MYTGFWISHDANDGQSRDGSNPRREHERDIYLQTSRVPASPFLKPRSQCPYRFISLWRSRNRHCISRLDLQHVRETMQSPRDIRRICVRGDEHIVSPELSTDRYLWNQQRVELRKEKNGPSLIEYRFGEHDVLDFLVSFFCLSVLQRNGEQSSGTELAHNYESDGNCLTSISL